MCIESPEMKDLMWPYPGRDAGDAQQEALSLGLESGRQRSISSSSSFSAASSSGALSADENTAMLSSDVRSAGTSQSGSVNGDEMDHQTQLPTERETFELSRRLVQLDLGDRNDACQGMLDLLSAVARRNGTTLAESMARSCEKYCHKKLHLRTLSEFQRIVSLRWGEHDRVRGWAALLDTFEAEIRLVMDPESESHDIGLALVYLAQLAAYTNVELGRPANAAGTSTLSSASTATSSQASSTSTSPARAATFGTPKPHPAKTIAGNESPYLDALARMRQTGASRSLAGRPNIALAG